MSDYWTRRNETKAQIEANFKTDAQYNRELNRIYSRAQREIQKEIQAELSNFARREQISMAEAQRLIDRADVIDFKEKASEYIDERGLSPEAQRQMRANSVNMRTSRLELLKSTINVELIAMADGENKLLTQRLMQDAVEEYTRQAGILGKTVPRNLDRIAREIVTADYKGTTFSNRIWSNQRKLRNEIENTLEGVLIRGQHPYKAGRALQGLVREEFMGKTGSGGARYVAQRLAVTESARTQTSVFKASMEEYDIEKAEWIAEPTACPICAEQDGKIFDVKGIHVDSDLTIPAHNWCRCAFSAYVDRAAWDADLTRRGL